MSFEVKCRYRFLGTEFADFDRQLFQLAGRPSMNSGTLLATFERDHSWIVPTFEEAAELREAIESTGEFSATIQEDINPDDDRHDPNPTIYGS